jgi:hypothetical protein
MEPRCHLVRTRERLAARPCSQRMGRRPPPVGQRCQLRSRPEPSPSDAISEPIYFPTFSLTRALNRTHK